MLHKLDPELIKHLDDMSSTDGRDTDRNALRIVRRSKNLKRAARAKPDVLVDYLASKQCSVLVD